MTTRPLWKKPAYGLMRSMPKTIEAQLSRANCMHSDAASQGGGWWQGCGAAYRMYRIELMLYPKNSATISVEPFSVIAFCVAWRDIAQFCS